MSFVVLCCGDREWADAEVIRSAISTLARRPTLVIHGNARGADKIAGRVAEGLGLPVRKFHADWGAQGRAAGAIRNRRMLNEGRPDLVLAFHDDLARSKGTRDMVRIALKKRVPVNLWDSRGMHTHPELSDLP